MIEFTASSVCSLIGLGFDLVGAGFLAYDTIMGPGARYQAMWSKVRLNLAREELEAKQRRTRDLPEPPYTPEEKAVILSKELPWFQQRVEDEEAKLRECQAHEDRAQNNALKGLFLLMIGFSLQGVGVVLGMFK